MVGQVIEYARDYYKLLPFLVALIIMQSVVGGMSSLPSYFVAGIYIISVLKYFANDAVNIDSNWILVLLYLPVTILIGQPHPVFNSWVRLLAFSSLYLCVTPTIQSEYARTFRHYIFNAAITICILISYASFVAYFLGINLFSAEGIEYEEYVGVAGLFSGITKQSMLLGPISGLATIFIFQYVIEKSNKLYWFLLLPTIGCVLFSASRSALGATFIGCLTLLYFRYKGSSKFFRYLFILPILAIITYPIWQSSTVALQNKHAIHEGANEKFDSRTGKFEARIDEFLINPITGIGFSAFDYYGKDTFNKETGNIEPGSSWLAILSMSGLIGVILIIRLFYLSYKHVISNNENPWLIGYLSFFVVHMVVEGYVYAGGSALAFLMWLSIGRCYDSIDNSYEIPIKI